MVSNTNFFHPTLLSSLKQTYKETKTGYLWKIVLEGVERSTQTQVSINKAQIVSKMYATNSKVNLKKGKSR